MTELSTLSLHADQTFEAFDLRRDELPAEAASSLSRAKALAEAFAADPQGWLVLNGPYGCGKTHLAAAIANRRMKLHNERAMFVVVPGSIRPPMAKATRRPARIRIGSAGSFRRTDFLSAAGGGPAADHPILL